MHSELPTVIPWECSYMSSICCCVCSCFCSCFCCFGGWCNFMWMCLLCRVWMLLLQVYVLLALLLLMQCSWRQFLLWVSLGSGAWAWAASAVVCAVVCAVVFAVVSCSVSVEGLLIRFHVQVRPGSSEKGAVKLIPTAYHCIRLALRPF